MHFDVMLDEIARRRPSNGRITGGLVRAGHGYRRLRSFRDFQALDCLRAALDLSLDPLVEPLGSLPS
jgi:hypothetical protein